MEGMIDADKKQFAELMAMLEVSCPKYARRWQPEELKLRNRTYWAALHDLPLWAVQDAVEDMIKHGNGEFPTPAELRSAVWQVEAFRDKMAVVHRKMLAAGTTRIETVSVDPERITALLSDLTNKFSDKEATDENIFTDPYL